MLIGVIADDFTGASDIANTLAKGVRPQGGLCTVQYLGVPTEDAPPEVEACVVALKTRSIPAKEAIAQSLAALVWLKNQGCRQIVFKYCSTFDSTPEGNIGPVGEAIADALGVKGVVACPAFPATGRTVYQGHLFVNDRLLNESGLENHPLNPMTDPNLPRWLRSQTASPVGLVAAQMTARGSHAISHALNYAAERGETLVIVDATSDSDLLEIGRACKDMPFVTGGSGVAMGLPRNFIDMQLAKGQEPSIRPVRGAEAILAGSCSGKTREQVQRHAKAHPTLVLEVDALMQRDIVHDDVVAFMIKHEGRSPLAYTSADPAAVARVQAAYGAPTVSATIDRFFGDTAKALVAAGVRRLVVAGGETSGAVVSALELGPLAIGREIDPGVPILISDTSSSIALALKSGNFGGLDFFSKALSMMENPR